MEAFTEIMLKRVYPAWPGVSTLCPGDGCLPFPEKGGFGEPHAHGALPSLSPFPPDPALISTWKRGQKNKRREGIFVWGSCSRWTFFGKRCDADSPPRFRRSRPSPSTGQRGLQPPPVRSPPSPPAVVLNLQGQEP